MLLDKSDVSQTEITRILEALGLTTNMCLQMSIDLSCKLTNLHIYNISIILIKKFILIMVLFFSYTWSRSKMGRNMLLFFTICSK